MTNKQIIENYMDKIWNQKKLDTVYEVFSKDVIIHSPLGTFRSADEMYKIVSKWLEVLPDMQVTCLHTVEGDGIVTSHWESKGTCSGEFHGVDAQGRCVEYQGVTLYRFDQGKVVEYWAYIDSDLLKKQVLGIEL